MISSAVNKLSVSLVLLVLLAIICSAQASCWRYGHSCWGGHGKRSGGKAVGGNIMGKSEHRHNAEASRRIPLADLSSPDVIYQSDEDTSAADDGIIAASKALSSSRSKLYSSLLPSSSLLSSFPSVHYNDELRDEIVNKRSDEEYSGTATAADYNGSNSAEHSEVKQAEQPDEHQANADSIIKAGSQSAEIFIGIPRISSGGGGGSTSDDLKPVAIATSEDNIKRSVGDLSTRKFPLENFNLYKLVRIVRRRK